MAKQAELFDITLSKDGTRMVAKLNAKKIVVTAYDGSELILNQGDYLNLQEHKDCIDSLDFLLQNDYIKQDTYNKKMEYLEMVRENFRVRVIARPPKK